MYNYLTQKAGHYNFYIAKKKEYQINPTLPFRVSPTPFYMNEEGVRSIEKIGKATSAYFKACIQLLSDDKSLRKLFDRGKPPILTPKALDAKYLFLRPDLIITDRGFTLCEIETSPFGLGLSAFLNTAYTESSFSTLVHPNILTAFFNQNLASEGQIIYTSYTKSYADQLSYLADLIISGTTQRWHASHISSLDKNLPIYRAFYLHQYLTDTIVRDLIDSRQQFLPTPTPQLEEKAIMGLVWDKRYQDFFASSMGTDLFLEMQKITPPTIIVGQENHFSGTLQVNSIRDIPLLPKSRRNFVLKISGFNQQESWGKGVIFLNEISSAKVKSVLEKAEQDQDNLYILQEFIPPKKVILQYENGEELVTMRAGVRITPYYSAESGQLISIKATGCENTNYIHGTSASVNMPIGRL